MNSYETIFICSAEVSQEKVEAVLDKVKSIINRADGKIISAELWGRRKLAYPIRHNREGFYLYILFSALAEAPALLDRYYRVTDTILRGLTIKIDPRHIEKILSSTKTSSGETVVSSTVTTPSPVSTTETVVASEGNPC